MARLLRAPTIEVLQDPLDMENKAFAAAEIKFHVKPQTGEEWPSRLTATCLMDGVPAVVPGAVDSLRKWDKDAAGSFYCYAPVGYLSDGVHLTLRVHPEDEHGRAQEEVKWQGEFRVRREGDQIWIEEIES